MLGHAIDVARAALRIRRYLERRNAAHPQEWLARIGINTGPVIGSLVGVQRYVYDLFGPGVNMAARMESLSDPMQITLNEATAALLADDFVLSETGEVEVKGFRIPAAVSARERGPLLPARKVRGEGRPEPRRPG